jgi:glycosyltransferase involved in cell wall biosynthesis
MSESLPRARVAATVITLNEERVLRGCLESVRWVDEIVVLDSGSTDATPVIAREFTNRFFHHPFDHYAAQKNHAATLASADWILSLDADERCTPELQREIETFLAAPDAEACRIPIENIYFGRPAGHVLGIMKPVRLYRRSVCRYEGEVHEKIAGGRIRELTAPLRHESCATAMEWKRKHRRYVRMETDAARREGRRFSIKRMLLSPWRVFWLRFFRLKGWKDGRAGWIIAVEMALSTLRAELQLLKPPPSPYSHPHRSNTGRKK